MESTILTNMCMVIDEEGRVLVQMHGGDWEGWCFPGGHVEPKESFVESVIREVWEESGLTIQNPKICGIKQFFLEDGRRYVVLLFQARQFTGDLRSSSEGEVRWMSLEELESQQLPSGFREMLPVFLNDSKQELYFGEDQTITYL